MTIFFPAPGFLLWLDPVAPGLAAWLFVRDILWLLLSREPREEEGEEEEDMLSSISNRESSSEETEKSSRGCFELVPPEVLFLANFRFLEAVEELLLRDLRLRLANDMNTTTLTHNTGHYYTIRDMEDGRR